MKQIFILTVLISAYISSFACPTTITQSNWRWRNSDGSETSATWKANQTTPISYNNNEVLRLRIELVNHSKRDGLDDALGSCIREASVGPSDSLQYSTNFNDANSWKNIGNNPSMAFVLAGSTPFIAQGEATTAQITGSTNAYSAGKMMVSDTVYKNVTIQPSGRTEVEWAITGTSNLLPNTTYYFRVRNITKVYNTYPSLTTGTTLPIKLSSFNVNNEGKKVKIEWSTASEVNNDYFNIQRSTGGRAWETINKVNSKGNSSVTTNYYLYDYGPPLTGAVYYRLQQYDKDGQFSFSDVQSVKMFSADRPIVSVIPNPARSDINFKLENTAVKNVQATLTDVNGRTLHEQAFKNVQPGNLNRLDIKRQPATGIYILKLKGDGLSESVKVIVQ